jgi:hypothetical protein
VNVVPLGAGEKADLALLGAADSGLMLQSAGDRVYIGDDGRRHWRRGYTYGLGGVVLTVLLVVALIIVLGH